MPKFDPASIERFRYTGFEIDAGRGELRFHYSLDDQVDFDEVLLVEPGYDWDDPAAREAARLVYLLAGVSYYKAAAPPVLDLGAVALRTGEPEFLKSFFVEGLGEFAYRNGLDLSGLSVAAGIEERGPVPSRARAGSPLVPFGGGIDSIVTVEAVRHRFPSAALCVVSPSGRRFDALEEAAELTGLPVVRAERTVDQLLLRSGGLGFLNGHVPITGIISAIAVLLAVLEGRDAVVMSNEWSASVGNLALDGRTINHQYSKSLRFESDFRRQLADSFDPPVEYFSLLRSMSTPAIARRFAELTDYHPVFRSCNRAFFIDEAQRLDRWCGICDKCCFVDLVLAPFMDAGALQSLFGGGEPLENPSLVEQFRTLIGTNEQRKPFECVGDVNECRAAAVMAAGRPDRAGNQLLARLAAEASAAGSPDPAALMAKMAPDFVPDVYAPEDLLV